MKKTAEKRPFASVVIPTYNRKSKLPECLEALSRQSYPKESYEIVVVSDGSTDGTNELLQECQKNAQFKLELVFQNNQGVSGARNAGIKKARGEIVCFTDDDCIAEKDWLENLVKNYTDERIGCVGGMINSYPAKSFVEKYADRKKLLNQENFLVCGPAITSNTSYRREILLDVGGFDPDLTISEDGDLGIRVKLKGFSSVYARDAVIFHKHRANLKSFLIQQYKWHAGRSRLNKKYPMYFKPGYKLIIMPPRIALAIIRLPYRVITSPFSGDPGYHVAEPVLDVLSFTSQSLGIISCMLHGKPYKGEPYTKRIDFFEDESKRAYLKKALRKIGRKT